MPHLRAIDRDLGISKEPNPVTVAGPSAPIPPAPAGHLLDEAQVLRPEAAASLSAKLVAAKASEVEVYVVTLRSLNVRSSQQISRLQELARAYAAAWIGPEIGAILIFDDESGLITLEMSKGTDHRYGGFVLEAELRGPLAEASKSGLAREKIERVSEITVGMLTRLQTKYLKEAQRQRVANLIMGVVALLGVGLAIYSAVAKPKETSVNAPGPAVESKPLDF